MTAFARRIFFSRNHLAALFIFVLLSYTFIKSKIVFFGDSKYTLLVSESLLRKASFRLDGYGIPKYPVKESLISAQDGPIYQVEIARDHLYYLYPPGSSVLSLPFVAVMDYMGKPIVTNGVYNPENEVAQQMILAPLLMAALGVIFYYTARLLRSVGWSILLALGATLGTQVWTTASRALFAHTWGLVLLGCVAYLLLANETGRGKLNPLLLASLLSWSYIVRPTNSAFIIGVTCYVLLYARSIFIPYALTGAFWLTIFVSYSWSHFGTLLPSYFRTSKLSMENFWEGFAGTLISPSRGLFILVPTTLFLVCLAARYWSGLKYKRLLFILFLVSLGQICVAAGFSNWIGGNGFGPRYTTELVPVFLLASILVVPIIEQSALIQSSGGFFLLLSIVMNARGANSPLTAKWNDVPVPIDLRPSRAWDWTHPQVLAGIIPSPPPDVLPILNGRLSFALGAAHLFQGDGWSGPETDFCWTEEDRAYLYFQLQQTDATCLRINLSPLVAHNLKKQRLRLSLNGKNLASLDLADRNPKNYLFSIPAGLLQSRNQLVFLLPDATSPHAVTGAADLRKLGVAVRWLELGSCAELLEP